MLKETINADYIAAFKTGDTVKKNLLSVVKGEIQTQEKNTGVTTLSDENVVKILNKFVKSLKETLAANPDNETTQKELAIIEGYLPKQLTTEEIQETVNKLIESGLSSMGEFMRHFKDLPVDRQIVADIIKQSINK
jgi:uncharacterized protein YqeY